MAAAVVAFAAAQTGPATTAPEGRAEVSETRRIVLSVGGTEVSATLHDNAAARAFSELLPLTLELEDYAGTELVSDLPAPLPTHDAPAGMDPAAGDLTYYAPWGNLAIFYRDFRYASGLVPLGRIDGPLDLFGASRPVTVTIERAP